MDSGNIEWEKLSGKPEILSVSKVDVGCGERAILKVTIKNTGSEQGEFIVTIPSSCAVQPLYGGNKLYIVAGQTRELEIPISSGALNIDEDGECKIIVQDTNTQEHSDEVYFRYELHKAQIDDYSPRETIHQNQNTSNPPSLLPIVYIIIVVLVIFLIVYKTTSFLLNRGKVSQEQKLEKYCEECGETYPSDFDYCAKCGKSLIEKKQGKKRPQNKIVDVFLKSEEEIDNKEK